MGYFLPASYPSGYSRIPCNRVPADDLYSINSEWLQAYLLWNGFVSVSRLAPFRSGPPTNTFGDSSKVSDTYSNTGASAALANRSMLLSAKISVSAADAPGFSTA